MILATLLLLLLAPVILTPATAVTLTLDYRYVDVEIRELSWVTYYNGTFYAAGSTGNYVIVAAYRDGVRLWMQSISLPGNSSILNLSYRDGVLDVIAYSRLQANTSIWVVRLNPKGEVLDKRLYANLPPRFLPLTALPLGDSIYIAGASYILGQEFNYMVARVSQKGVEWFLEDMGSRGVDVVKCLTTTLGSRLVAVGDNSTNIYVMLLSQTGNLLSHSLLSYPNTNLTLSVNGCTKLSETEILVYGALSIRPFIALVSTSPGLGINITSLRVIANITGVVTTATANHGIITLYISSGDQALIAVYRVEGGELRFLNIYNVTDIARGYIALSASPGDSRLAYVGSNGVSAFILALVMVVQEGGVGRLPRIPVLDVIGDPRLTAILLTVILVTIIFVAYRKRRRVGS